MNRCFDRSIYAIYTTQSRRRERQVPKYICAAVVLGKNQKEKYNFICRFPPTSCTHLQTALRSQSGKGKSSRATSHSLAHCEGCPRLIGVSQVVLSIPPLRPPASRHSSFLVAPRNHLWLSASGLTTPIIVLLKP